MRNDGTRSRFLAARDRGQRTVDHKERRSPDAFLYYNGEPVPQEGQKIEYRDGRFIVPDRSIIPFIEGDGIGRDIWKAAVRVLDSAVEQVYGGQRRVIWYEIFAGEKAYQQFQEWLPQGTLDAIGGFRIAIKGLSLKTR